MIAASGFGPLRVRRETSRYLMSAAMGLLRRFQGVGEPADQAHLALADPDADFHRARMLRQHPQGEGAGLLVAGQLHRLEGAGGAVRAPGIEGVDRHTRTPIGGGSVGPEGPGLSVAAASRSGASDGPSYHRRRRPFVEL